LIETLVGSGRVEVFNLPLDHVVKLFEMQDEQVVQALSAQAADETLAKGIRLRGLRGCLENFDAAGRHRKVLSKFAIPITDQVFRLLIPGRGFPQLLGHPLVSGISGDAGMHHPPGVQFHDHENVDGPKEQIVRHGEIAGPEVWEMVLEKCGPGLP